MRIILLAAGLASTMSLNLAPAQAQGVEDLPDRPIARSEVLAVVKRQFAAMDTNRDGTISPTEFDTYRARTEAGSAAGTSGLAAFDHLGRHWFERADENGDGRVTLPEAQSRPLKLFDMADTDGDGVVSRSEQQVAALLMSLGGR
ncbi:EF-hand domain-containing protein [Glacieibacterium sp.]|uniref:EF-hand domain-containing protein n=1 Tax=Glacieibacterium sp. TaxID=2860237 RepID=UPI003AFFE8CE